MSSGRRHRHCPAVSAPRILWEGLAATNFSALLSGQVTVDTVQEKARLICEALQFSIGSAPTLHITASIGVHVVSGAIPNFEYLYEKADFALYEAKARGKNCFQISEGKAGNISKRHVYDTVPDCPSALYSA